MAKAVQKMVMKQSDVRSRLTLLHNWDYQCILCGCHFRDIASVTFEHVVPKSLGGKKNKKRRGNSPDFAPSHYNCNQFRQNWSLVRAIGLLRRQRKRMGERQFYEWINKAVPNRIIAPEFMAIETTPPTASVARVRVRQAPVTPAGDVMTFDKNGNYVPRYHPRSSTVKKDSMRDLTPREKDIHDVRSWPPGTFMVIDQRDEWKRRGSPSNIKPFVGLGMVVANNGVDRIRVLWGANCRDAFLEYEVAKLNPDVIRFLDSYSE